MRRFFRFSNTETIPFLQRDASVNCEEDPDESRETETTDDECHNKQSPIKNAKSGVSNPIEEPAPGCSYINYPSTYDLSNSGEKSQSSSSTLDSQMIKGQEAISYFASNKFTSSSDSSKASSITSSADFGYVVEYTHDKDGNVDYVDIDFDDNISEVYINRLLKKMNLHHYTALSCEGEFMLAKCRRLFERDYFCDVMSNRSGSLSRHYPATLIIPYARRSVIAISESLDGPDFDLKVYSEKVERSVCSRLLTRFVVPVILLDNKFICRSGSLTVRKSAVFERARKKRRPTSQEISASAIHQIARKLAGSIADFTNRTCKAASQLFFPNSMAKLRYIDAEILRDLGIQHICDLMVEDRRMFKRAIRLSSSEKINRTIFKDCAIEQMPYPGCSFFRQYHNEYHNAYGLVFDWKRPDVNVKMKFSVIPDEIFPKINWSEYKRWDLINLTRNYLMMLLHFLAKDSGGMLIHCISGWDRTPLFISLLRISLWGDGVIHESLDDKEITYLTLAYDWYLFGHNFPYRRSKKQDILHFCFNFLENIANDDFSFTRMFHELTDEEKRGRVFPDYQPNKRMILRKVRAYFIEAYQEYI